MIAHGGVVAQQSRRERQRKVKSVPQPLAADEVVILHDRRIHIYSIINGLEKIAGTDVAPPLQ